MILQTLQQLRDVYGDSVDKIVQGNTSNIVFLKSTDDSMLDTLQKMSGVTHKSFKDSKTITVDMSRIWAQVEHNETINISTREVPVISYNDMAFIPERNSIVFRAGDAPIWNRNQTILPMSWRLFKNTIEHYGHEYSLQTIPTLSSALDFDVRKNQPDFTKMLNKRMHQAYIASEATDLYQEAYGYSDYEMEQLDPDVKSDEIMQIINEQIYRNLMKERGGTDDLSGWEEAAFRDMDTEVNDEVIAETEKARAEAAQRDAKIYADNLLARSDLIKRSNEESGNLDDVFIRSYLEVWSDFSKDTDYFRVDSDKSLYGLDGKPYIVQKSSSAYLDYLNKQAKDPNSRIFAEAEIDSEAVGLLGTWQVTKEFYEFLRSLPAWKFAKGRFDREVARQIQR